MMVNRRRLNTGIASLALATLATPALAQADYPNKPVKIIVPYAAGGGTDTVVRVVTKAMAPHLGQTIVVDNKPGGGTVIGASEAARAAPDGYTLLWSDNTTYALNPFLYKKLPYAPLELTPITKTLSGGLMLVVSPSLGVDSVKGLIDLVKSKPGKVIYASAGNGTPHHMAMEALKQKAGLFMVHLPYKGEGPAAQDVLGGSAKLMFLGSTVAKQHAEVGAIKVLAGAAKTRNPTFPDVPTLAEAGVPGYESSYWHALTAPAGTPDTVVKKVHAAYAKAIQDPEVQAFLKRYAAGSNMDLSTPEQLRDFMKTEHMRARELIKAIGLQPN